MQTSLAARRLITSGSIVEYPVIGIEDGRITFLSSRDSVEQPKASLNLADTTLTAGLFDIHMHGAVGHDVMEGSSEAQSSIARFLASHGVTQYLATTVTASMDFTLKALEGIAKGIEKGPAPDEARPVGIHIEGPFLSHKKRGMHPEQFLLAPTPDLLNRFWEASSGHIKLMTIAPEVPGSIETIRRANELGIRSSIGHSEALKSEATAAVNAGAVSATHTFNAMRALDHREPGILGVVLDNAELYADLICDGIHVAPELVRLWFKAKGEERAILITDSLEAAGMPNGDYRLGETKVHVENGRCVTETGVLAGSVLSLEAAVHKMQEFTGVDLPVAIRMASRNPARMLGLEDSLSIGSEATFNVYSADGLHQQTILRGKLLDAI
jgi:N-acetylglucosamine-6-phosphate deacetylase